MCEKLCPNTPPPHFVNKTEVYVYGESVCFKEMRWRWEGTEVIAFTCLVLAHCPHFIYNCINLLFALFCLSFSLSLSQFSSMFFFSCRAQQSGAAAAGCVGGGGGGQSRSGSRKLPPPLLRSRTLPAIILPGLPAVSLHTDKQTFHLGA